METGSPNCSGARFVLLGQREYRALFRNGISTFHFCKQMKTGELQVEPGRKRFRESAPDSPIGSCQTGIDTAKMLNYQ
jgi:hypothetical protein